MPSSRRSTRSSRADRRASLDVAQQDGGSHGAFTRGVVDRLLQEEDLPIAAVSGTSAGALNAAVLACGWAEGGPNGGREGARAARRVSGITCNAGLLGELRAIAFVQKLVAEGRLDAILHALQALHALGVAAATAWLEQRRSDVAVRASLDIRKIFLGQGG